MNPEIKRLLWNQFGAAIDMVARAIESCPDRLWSDTSRDPQFWYVTYHALFWLDYYLSDPPEGFVPPAPFTLSEFDPTGVPDRIYSRAELEAYLAHCRKKCETMIDMLTDGTAKMPRRIGRAEGTFLELSLYNMRHVQHHAAQLNLILRQTGIEPQRWVSRAIPS